MGIRHWQDAGSLLLGAWLMVSPLALGFGEASAWVTATLGLCVVVFAIEGLLLPSYLEELCEAGLGVLLVMAPWLLRYDTTTATVNSAAVGMLAIALAASELSTDREFKAWWSSHRHRPAG